MRLHAGTTENIPTPFGPIAVTIAGDRSKTPLLTYHDVGVNHQSCFQALMAASSHRDLLVRNFCFYHIDAPGCEVRGPRRWVVRIHCGGCGGIDI